MPIVIVPERNKFCFQVGCRPKQQLVQTLSSDGSNQSLDERMRPGNIGDGFDFRDTKDSEVGTPLMKSIQRIMIRTQIFRKACTSNGLLEHPAERRAIDDASLNSKPDDSARV